MIEKANEHCFKGKKSIKKPIEYFETTPCFAVLASDLTQKIGLKSQKVAWTFLKKMLDVHQNNCLRSKKKMPGAIVSGIP